MQQNELTAKINDIEEQIREAEKTLDSLTGKTVAILNRYLN